MASIVSAGTTSATALNMSADTSGVLQLASNNGTVALTIGTTQNIGFGTTSPNFECHISTGSTASITQPTAGSYGLYVQQNTSGSVGGIYIQDGASNSGNSLFIGDNNGAVRLIVDADGNVGVATSTAITGYKMHVNGAVYQDQTANGTSAVPVVSGGYVCGPADANIYAGVRFLNSYLSNNASQVAFYVTNGTGSAYEAGRFNASGYLRVKTTQAGNYTIRSLFDGTAEEGIGLQTTSVGVGNMMRFLNSSEVTVGQITTTSTTTSYVTSSDYRLKNTIAPMTGALAKVSLLKPVTYKWNADGSDGEGFIAHELAEVCSYAVIGEKDAIETYTDDDGNEQTRPKYQGIDTSFLVATLTAAIQELNAKVTALENK